MDAGELTEPKGGGLFLTLDELRSICRTFGLFIVDDDDLLTLHYEHVDRWFRSTVRMGHKYGGWVPSHAGHGHDVEIRLCLGLPEKPLPIRKVAV